MKYLMQLIFFLLAISATSYCQNREDTVDLKDISIPSSPAFNLLDLTPKTIEKPGTVKSFTTSVVNQINKSGAGIPENFAMEFAPYWMVKHPSMTVFKYYGLTLHNKLEYKPNIFYGLRSTSISIGSVFKDSTKDSPLNVNYVGYSIKTNIINIRKRIVTDSLKKSIEETNKELTAILSQPNDCDPLNPNDSGYEEKKQKCIAQLLKGSLNSPLNNQRNYFSRLLTIRPVFTADIALASSTAFYNNKFDNRHSYRSGAWLTLAYSQPLLSRKAKKSISNLIDAKNYFNIYGFLRGIQQDSTVDFKNFIKRNFLDIGGRIEFELDRFSISLETVFREVSKHKNENSYRTVAILQYKVSNDLFLLGTFGKNFDSEKNLISLFGINWGFGNNSLYKKF